MKSRMVNNTIICLTLLLTYLLMPNVTRLAYSWLYPRERT